MFKKLTDFAHKRTALEAIGFYLAYLVLGILLGVLFAVIFGILAGVTQEKAYDTGVLTGSVVALVFSIGLPIMILQQKKQLNNFGYILLIALAGVLAVFAGCLAGLIPAAFLTTRTKKKSRK